MMEGGGTLVVEGIGAWRGAGHVAVLFDSDADLLVFHAYDGTTGKPFLQISTMVDDQRWARWAAHLAPTAAIEAIIAWLDAGQPDPGLAADRVRHVIAGVISAAAAHAGYDYLPPPTV